MQSAVITSVTLKQLSSEVTRMTEKVKSVFEELNSIDVNGHKEEKNGLSYLSWSWAWTELQKRYPSASYTIEKFGELRKPYLYDENTGYMVFTTVTIEGQTREMWLPVMDGANKAMKNVAYQYTVMAWDNAQHKKVPTKRTVQPATMFDINKAIMRCLVKNISMFGLGLYIYSGEDLPEQITEEETEIAEDQEERKKVVNAVNKQIAILKKDFKTDVFDPVIVNYVMSLKRVPTTDIDKLTIPELRVLENIYQQIAINKSKKKESKNG